ncbi:YHS domain protein [Stieleria bergensis]|uniref:YHS domain protein n=1 Tax=Stieleria bergensis TaxID=2528025 RepID=A0A517SRX0_9BACT|nr:YHS domain protein [Planctomycetes bacterium SV_7m_r]
MKKIVASTLAILLVATATAWAGEVDLKEVKCVIAPKAASADKSADYKDGKVYFCCGGCAGKFAKDSKPFATKANHQLVATKQYEQKGCPFSGGKVNPATLVSVEGTKVGFCCNNCKAKFDGTKDSKAKMDLVFSDKAFDKAFKKAK